MTTQPPPPRYRVVEQGRRLVVIDSLTGAPATRSAATPAPMPSKLPPAPERTRFDGQSTVVTHPLYDDKAPRVLTLDPGATQLIRSGRVVVIGAAVVYAVLIAAAPWLAVPLIALLNPRARAALRAPVTRWLDRYDADTSTG